MKLWTATIAIALALLVPATASATTIIAGPLEGEMRPEATTILNYWAAQSQMPLPNGIVTVVFDVTDEGVTHVNPWEPRVIHWWANGFGGDPYNTNSNLSGSTNFYVEMANVFQFTRRKAQAKYMKVQFERIFHPKHNPLSGWYNWPENWNWFGMAYLACATDQVIPNAEVWGFEYHPTPSQQARTCNLIRRVSDEGRPERMAAIAAES